jgi:beta-lactamase class A
MTRRTVLAAAGSLAALGGARAEGSENAIARLEAGAGGGRLGVYVHDTASGRRFGHRANERFAMCSTFKFLAVAATLAQIDKGREQADRLVHYTAADLLDYAPVTRLHVTEGAMSVAALCAAAITVSDNTAGNLLLARLGGPGGLTRFARTLGDNVTRLDRNEPTLNSATPGDVRDTTSPAAMAADMEAILAGDVLSRPSRTLLEAWLQAATRGLDRLRAGLPKDWIVGDKAGTGANGTHNDVAIIRPPRRRPIFVTAYLTGSALPDTACDAVLAAVGRAVAAEMR